MHRRGCTINPDQYESKGDAGAPAYGSCARPQFFFFPIRGNSARGHRIINLVLQMIPIR